jgi:hypothetical protein
MAATRLYAVLIRGQKQPILHFAGVLKVFFGKIAKR